MGRLVFNFYDYRSCVQSSAFQKRSLIPRVSLTVNDGSNFAIGLIHYRAVLPGKIVRNTRRANNDSREITRKWISFGFRCDLRKFLEILYIYIYARRTESFDFTSIYQVELRERGVFIEFPRKKGSRGGIVFSFNQLRTNDSSFFRSNTGEGRGEREGGGINVLAKLIHCYIHQTPSIFQTVG